MSRILTWILIILAVAIVFGYFFMGKSPTEVIGDVAGSATDVVTDTVDAGVDLAGDATDAAVDVVEAGADVAGDAVDTMVDTAGDAMDKTGSVQPDVEILGGDEPVIDLPEDTGSKVDVSYEMFTKPEFYDSIPVVSSRELEVEVSRELRECIRGGIAVGTTGCLQIKIQGEEWKFQTDPIYGFDYQEGNYYRITVKESMYDFSDPSQIPSDVSSKTLELVEITYQN